jgi:4'-phosphopantetheinyl transferase
LEARVCSPAEAAALDILHGDERERAFMAIWTRKEAYGKAIGVGLGFEWSSTSFNPDDARLAGVPGEWHARDVDLGVDVVATVVVEGDPPDVEVMRVDTRSTGGSWPT